MFHGCFILPVIRGTSREQQNAGSSQDNEQPGPSRRKRQPSMSETMPLYTLCKEDLESMDKEVSKKEILLPLNIINVGNIQNVKQQYCLKTFCICSGYLHEI